MVSERQPYFQKGGERRKKNIEVRLSYDAQLVYDFLIIITKFKYYTLF